MFRKEFDLAQSQFFYQNTNFKRKDLHSKTNQNFGLAMAYACLNGD
jgi:hypothetical protein